jgi:DNA helicase HerA-like ATPase
MAVSDVTFVGQVASVTGSIVRVRLRSDMPTTVLFVDGDSYRVGQIGAIFRIPLGYTHLYGVCTQVGADALPAGLQGTESISLEIGFEERLSGLRWMTLTLFGEAIGGLFERGVGQYPTVGDEVHLGTDEDLHRIYGTSPGAGSIDVGSIAVSAGITARLDLAGLVTRHSVVVGSTGAGKSNLVTTLLEEIVSGEFSAARVLVVDPHGEYPTALGPTARVVSADPADDADHLRLRVPYWALPLSELLPITFGPLQPNHESFIRERIYDMKVAAAEHLADSPPPETITADSPIPFSLRQLWHELDDFERQTFSDNSTQNETTVMQISPGDAETLTSAEYQPATAYNNAPYQNKSRRNIHRQLDLLKSRLNDKRLSFLFDPGGGYTPSLGGLAEADIDGLIRDWVGHDDPLTVLDLSGLPSELLATVVGTLLRVTYDMLFWAGELPISGRKQPLLIVLEEAHLFLPEGGTSPAHSTIGRIAKEGRKYGVGLMFVSQRPSDLDAAALSQCGTVISMRLTNTADRAKVASAFPDDLGGLVALLPSLRTGEGLFVGEAIEIPSRIRVRRARNKPIGDDPQFVARWTGDRPDNATYSEALRNWRRESDVD